MRGPGSVTVVVLLVWISAILTIIGGVLLLVLAPVAQQSTGISNAGGGFVLAGIVALIIGLIIAAVASRLGKGGNGARLIVTILEALQIAGALGTLFTVRQSGVTTQAVITIVLAVVIIALLWNRAANEFFAAN